MKTYIQTREKTYAFEVDGVSKDYPHKPFGRQLEERQIIENFKRIAQTTWVSAKHKNSLTCLKKWVKEQKPNQFYACWTADSEFYKDDSVQVYFI